MKLHQAAGNDHFRALEGRRQTERLYVVELANRACALVGRDSEWSLDAGDKAAVRALRHDVAIVFQQYDLFQNLTALENVMITPTKIEGQPLKQVEQVEQDAIALLKRVRFGHRRQAYSDHLSGRNTTQRYEIASGGCTAASTTKQYRR